MALQDLEYGFEGGIDPAEAEEGEGEGGGLLSSILGAVSTTSEAITGGLGLPTRDETPERDDTGQIIDFSLSGASITPFGKRVLIGAGAAAFLLWVLR